MSGRPFRLPAGGLIDREALLSFQFEGEHVPGFEGDTVASALLANGAGALGKSLRHGRSRGIASLSVPSVRSAGRVARAAPLPLDLKPTSESAPHTAGGIGEPAADEDLFCGAAAFDVAVAGAGAAGLTAALVAADAGAEVCLLEEADEFGGWLLHERCSVGGTPAQVWVRELARKAAGHPNIRVYPGARLLDIRPGGKIVAVNLAPRYWSAIPAQEPAKQTKRRQNSQPVMDAFRGGYPGGQEFSALRWMAGSSPAMTKGGEIDFVPRSEAGLHDRTSVLTAVTVRPRFRGDGSRGACIEGGVRTAASRRPSPPRFGLTARRIVVATGAFEQPLAFQDNDRPGIMLASAVRGYRNRFAVGCGEAVLIATNNDGGYLTAFDLASAGIGVAGIVDERPRTPSFIFDEAEKRRLRVLTEAYVVGVHYPGALEGAIVHGLDGRRIASLACDCIAMAGGLRSAAFRASGLNGVKESGSGIVAAAGSAAGVFPLRGCISSGAKAGAEAALAAGFVPSRPWTAPDADPLLNTHRVAGPALAIRGNPKKVYLDFDGDITAHEAALNPAVASLFAEPKTDRLYGASALGFLQGKSWT